MYYGEYELIIFYYMTLANYIILAIILYTHISGRICEYLWSKSLLEGGCLSSLSFTVQLLVTCYAIYHSGWI